MWSTRTHLPIPISSVLRRSTQSQWGRPAQSGPQSRLLVSQRLPSVRNLNFSTQISSNPFSSPASASGLNNKTYFSSNSNSKGLAALSLALVIGTATTLLTTSYNDLFSFKNPLGTVYADTDSTAVGHYSDASISTSELEKYPDAHRYASPSTRLKAIQDLQTIFAPAQLSTNQDELLSHAQAGGTHHHPHKPDVVVYVESTEDVVKCVRWAGEWGVPVVPYSGEF